MCTVKICFWPSSGAHMVTRHSVAFPRSCVAPACPTNRGVASLQLHRRSVLVRHRHRRQNTFHQLEREKPNCASSTSEIHVCRLLAHVRTLVAFVAFCRNIHLTDCLSYLCRKQTVSISTLIAAVSLSCQSTRVLSSDNQASPTLQEDTAARARRSHIKDDLQLEIKLHPPYFAQ